jgi:hypothetical protein
MPDAAYHCRRALPIADGPCPSQSVTLNLAGHRTRLGWIRAFTSRPVYRPSYNPWKPAGRDVASGFRCLSEQPVRLNRTVHN